MTANMFLFIGLAFVVLELIKLFPIKQIHLPKMIQLTILTLTNLILIVVLPDINLILSLSVMFITLFFTLLPFLLGIRLNKEMFHNNYLSRTRIPEILYLLNWDKYSKSKITLKKVYIELLKGDLEAALTILTKANTDYDLSKYYLWHQDVLNMLLSTRNIGLADSYLSSLNIDLTSQNLPVGLAYSMIRIYSEYGNINKASQCLKYIDENYHDIQHRYMNLTMYLIFYALAGHTESFDMLLNKYPQMRKLSTLPYWRAILLLKTGDKETAISLLNNYLSKLPPEHKELSNFIKTIINNPDLYYSPKEKDTYIYETAGQYITYEFDSFKSDENIIKETFPREDNFKNPDIFIYNKKKKISGTLILCGVIVLITIAQFIMSSSKSFIDFILIKSTIFDYIRLGGFNIELVNQGQWIRFITSIFLHGDWLHLIVNMYSLFILGRLAEKSFGSFQMFFIFLVSGITGNLLTYFFNMAGIVGVGASGGVFGILGAFIIYIIWRRKDLYKSIFRNLIINFAIIIGINIFYGLANPQINNLAHLGGFIGGIIFSSIYLLLFKKEAISKVYNIFTGILAFVIFAITLILWYPMINYDYFSNMEFTNEVEKEGYIMKIPNAWEIQKADKNKNLEMFFDNYSGSNIYVYRITDPNEMSQIKKSIVINNFKVGEDGWNYLFIERYDDKQKLSFYDYTYIKIFPESVCTVKSLELKEVSNKFKPSLEIFLSTIKEK